MQVTIVLLITIFSLVALLIVAVYRMGTLRWLKVSAQFLPVPKFTFEASAEPRSETLSTGEDRKRAPASRPNRLTNRRKKTSQSLASE